MHSILSRFGLKIAAAMLLIAIIPLVASILLVDQVVEVSDGVAEGQRQSLASPLTKAARAYRELFAAQKHLFLARTDAVVSEVESLAERTTGAINDGYRDNDTDRASRRFLGAALESIVAHYRVDGLRRIVWEKVGRMPLSATSRTSDVIERVFTVRRRLAAAAGDLSLTFGAPRALFDDFEHLGRAQQTGDTIAHLRGSLADYYRTTFVLLFGAALLAAMLLAFLVAHTTVRRVAKLLEATRRVTDGDLATRVVLRGNDELARLGHSFNEMVSRIEEGRERITYLEKVSAWQDIARRLAHEIKNPLTPIQLALQQVADTYRGDDERFQQTLSTARDIVTEEVGSLRRMVDAFSTFAQMPALRTEPLNLHQLFGDFLQSHSDLARRANLEWDPSSPRVVVEADRMLLKNILFNLIENAVLAAEAAQNFDLGEFKVVIRVGRDLTQKNAKIIIEDNGPGMDEVTQKRVFEPYFSQTEGGSGLGLAIVKKTVLEHGGSIRIDSARGKGAQFTVVLPVRSSI